MQAFKDSQKVDHVRWITMGDDRLEAGYQAGEKPVGEEIVDSVLSKQIDDLEPTLTRHGYTPKVLTEMLGTKPGEIKALFKQTLEVDRARELKEQMLAAGLPL